MIVLCMCCFSGVIKNNKLAINNIGVRVGVRTSVSKFFYPSSIVVVSTGEYSRGE